MAIQFPLDVRFKLIALAPRMFVTDPSGASVCYVSQKVLKLREDIQVFADESRTTELYRIKADRIIDFGASYAFTNSITGQPMGAVKSKGWRTLWRATYPIIDTNGTVTHTITEDNPWVKMGDALLREVPILGLFSGYFLNPTYTAKQEGTENEVMKLRKMPGFFEGKYRLELLDQTLTEEEQVRIMLSFLLMVQFMRSRG
jgi:hypothetical protein